MFCFLYAIMYARDVAGECESVFHFSSDVDVGTKRDLSDGEPPSETGAARRGGGTGSDGIPVRSRLLCLASKKIESAASYPCR